MIWIKLMCSNFMIVRLKLKQQLAKHTASQVYTPLPSPSELLDSFTDPLFRDVVITLMESHLCSFLATVEVPYSMNAAFHAGTFSPQGPHRPSLPMTITSQFCDSCPCASTTRFGDTAVLHRLHDHDHLLEERFTVTTLSDNNSHNLTACYLPKWQLLSKSFPNALCI
jgi:hypothetical protein